MPHKCTQYKPDHVESIGRINATKKNGKIFWTFKQRQQHYCEGKDFFGNPDAYRYVTLKKKQGEAETLEEAVEALKKQKAETIEQKGKHGFRLFGRDEIDCYCRLKNQGIAHSKILRKLNNLGNLHGW
tara:strand:+ start:89 stop:472 length:384 start_codon:yes stop_codon:yes gene_type:complete